MKTGFRWAVDGVDESARDRARAALRLGHRLVAVADGPDASRVPAPRVMGPEALFAAADGVIVGGEQAAERAAAALRAGLHVSAATPVAPDSDGFLRLAHLARRSRRTLHLFCPTLFGPAIRTLKGQVVATGSVTAISLDASIPGSGGARALARAHDAHLQAALAVSGPVKRLDATLFEHARLTMVAQLDSGATAALRFAWGETHFQLEVEAHASWRLTNGTLFRGHSMSTLTDTGSPAELAMREFVALLGGRTRPTLSHRARHHALKLVEAVSDA